MLTSPLDCQFIISDYVLAFDKFSLDKKRVSRLIFNGLQGYMLNYHQDAKSNVYWIGHKGLEKIMNCDYTIFTYQYFTLSKINFPEPEDSLWNQEMRREILSVKVNKLFSDLNSHQFVLFNHMLDFIEMATISTQEYDDMERSFKHKVKELESYGIRNVEALLKRRVALVIINE